MVIMDPLTAVEAYRINVVTAERDDHIGI